MSKISLKPTHKVITDYYAALHNYSQLGFHNEGSVSPPFAILLESAAKQLKWNLIQQYQKKSKGKSIRIDGAVVDQWGLPHGYWEAKDSKDDLRKEVKNKFSVGYPRDNMIFQEPAKAILWQNEREIGEFDLLKADELIRLLELFFDYTPPAFEEWEDAAKKFHEQLPELGDALLKVLDDAKVNNKAFQVAFATFYDLCRTSINPNLSEKAVEEMLIQHLLTERIFRTVFQNSEFTQRNAIAKEIETVILALTSQSFSREEFLKRFDHFYKAIEQTASTIDSFPEKQTFLNNIYERFFQGFSVDVADTHGIVYTPQPIVNFMVKSVEDILQKEFGKSLSDENIHILDPFVGTGNFMVHIIDEIKKTSLERKYANELHCNEVILLPYYIASMNIEHEYFEKIGRYEPFEGICLVDTFDMAEQQQSSLSFMTEENSARIEKQKKSPITVVIGNPPYNAGQVNENDNNKNRKYKEIDRRVAETYAQDSKATNKSALSDPYVKAIRWASDRISDDGIVAFVSNSSYIDSIAFDGMRHNLSSDFDLIYLIDLKGDVRKDSMRDGIPIGEANTVFGLAAMVGISIGFFVKHRHDERTADRCRGIYYASVDWRAKRLEKFKFLESAGKVSEIAFETICPDSKNNWLNNALSGEFDSFLSIGDKETKERGGLEKAIFKNYSRGIETTRDNWLYNFQREQLARNILKFTETYNQEVRRWQAEKRDPRILDSFVTADDIKISWSSSLKQDLLAGNLAVFDETKFRNSAYRVFTKKLIYFDDLLIHRRGQFPRILPIDENERENLVICVTAHTQVPFNVIATNLIPDHGIGSRAGQTFPFYTYNEDGTNRRENITDWALEQFREHYTKDEGGRMKRKPPPGPIHPASLILHPLQNGTFFITHTRSCITRNTARNTPRI